MGEDVLLRWEIVNTGNDIDYFAPKYNVYDRMKFVGWKEKEMPHIGIKGSELTRNKGEYKKFRGQIGEIEPGATIKFREINLTGDFGTGIFAERGIGILYLEPREYSIYLEYFSGEDAFHKVYSDTINIVIKEPTGFERNVWELYKAYKREDILAVDEEKQIQYALNILKNYSKSVYVESLLNGLALIFKVYRRGEFEDDVIRIKPYARELLDYLEENIDKFKDKDRKLKNALLCILQGEFLLGTSIENVKNLINQMNVPLNNKIKKVLNENY